MTGNKLNLFQSYKSTLRRLVFLLPVASVLFSGCVKTLFLRESNQYLLTRQSVTGNKAIPREELEPLFRQTANRKTLGFMPYLWAYYVGERFYNKEKEQIKLNNMVRAIEYQSQQKDLSDKEKRAIVKLERKAEKQAVKVKDGNWFMRKVGEPPVIFDSLKAKLTAREMEATYYTRGFFDARVKYETDVVKLSRNMSVTYHITEGKPLYINRIRYLADDSTHKAIIAQNLSTAFVKTGDLYNENQLTAERDRIDKLLRSHGYYKFSRNYIAIDGDTASRLDSGYANIDFIILNPPDGSRHKQFLITDMTFTIENPAGLHTRPLDTTVFNRVKYLSRRKYAFRILDSKLQAKPGNLYDSEKLVQSQAQIGSMDIFRIVNYNIDTSLTVRYTSRPAPEPLVIDSLRKFNRLLQDTTGHNKRDTLSADSVRGRYLKTDIRRPKLPGDTVYRKPVLRLNAYASEKFQVNFLASRLPRYQLSDELGLIMSAGAPGPFGSIGFKVRNMLNRFDIFEVNLRGSREGVFSNFQNSSVVFLRTEIGINTSLTFPVISLPFGIGDRLNPYNPRTKLILGFTSLSAPDYRRAVSRATLTYSVQPNVRNTFGLSPIDVSVINTPFLSTAYNKYLTDQADLYGNNLNQSFKSSLVTAFTGYYMYTNNTPMVTSPSWYFRTEFEIGGLLPKLVDRTFYGDTNKIFDNLRIYRYTRIRADLRYYLPLHKGTVLATRISGGIVNPFGGPNSLPYEKYFFSGGTNSLRGWLQRRLGPGGFANRTNGEITYTFEQPGNVQLEANIELRQKLIGFIEGALFADIGNVWLTSHDTTKPESQFYLNQFYRQLAMDAGIGLRFNFSFLIVRFDAATKVYEPGQLPGNRWRLGKIGVSEIWNKGQTQLQIGVGYPF
ncbi:MAG: BamA/TamA family outer membrane protein [Bacteroidota bacterium]